MQFRVLIDCSGLQGRSWNRGIGKYIESLLSRIEGSNEIQFEVLISNFDDFRDLNSLQKMLAGLVGIKCVHIWTYENELPVETNQLAREVFINSLEVDAILITDLFESGYHIPISIKKHFDIPTFLILYDLIPYEDPKTFLQNRNSYDIYHDGIENLQKADHVFCISNYTRETLLKHFKHFESRATFIGGAANSNFENKNHVHANQLIAILGDDPRKNVSNLTTAWAEMPTEILEKHTLKIVGNFSTERIEYFTKSCGLDENFSDSLRFTGEISDLELEKELNQSIALIHPALSEGLGLPILEAISVGVPALCSNNSSMTEIGRLGAILRPEEVSNLQESMFKVIVDDQFREKVLQSQKPVLELFNWSYVCDVVLRIFRVEIPLSLEKDQIQPGAQMVKALRCVVIAPSSTAKTGISRFADFLHPYLQEEMLVDFISTESLTDLESSMQILKKYDQVIVHLGNSPHHKNAFAIAANFPTILVCHDIKLGNTLKLLHKNEPKWMEELEDLSSLEGDLLHQIALQRILNLSLGVVVHSDSARNFLFNLGYPGKKILLLDHPILALNPVEDKFICDEDELKTVISSGFITPNKYIELLIEGVALFNRESKRSLNLRLQGEVDSAYKAKIVEHAKNLNVNIEITGYIQEDRYLSNLKESHLAVQLRALDSGESSGVLSDLMHFGVPTIVNEIGSFIQLPSDVVLKIPGRPSASDIAMAISEMLVLDRRIFFSSKAIEFSNSQLNPKLWSQRVLNFVESRYKLDLLHNMRRKSQNCNESQILKINEICLNMEKENMSYERRIVVSSDVSNLVATPFVSGIQRATLEIHSSLSRVFCGSQYLLRPINLRSSRDSSPIQNDQISKDVVLSSTPALSYLIDALLLIDLNFHFFESPEFNNVLNRKIPIIVNIYDLLPISNPEWFPPGTSEQYFFPWLKAVLLYASDIIVNSEATRAELIKLDVFKNYKGSVTVAPLGVPRSNMHSKPERILGQSLIVGTIEPRKGHADVLDAFDQMEAKGIAVTLHIVGRQGWMVEEVIERISQHKSLNRTLFWHKACSDSELQHLYSQSVVTLVASKGEGFGLPILEALSFGSHVLARDIPVFHEVGGTYIDYFDSSNLCEIWTAAILDEDFQGTENGLAFSGYDDYSQALANILHTRLQEPYFPA
jgi:glycosyltransferase involved in cell wall biosynthesis